jgi:dCMP deaminase
MRVEKIKETLRAAEIFAHVFSKDPSTKVGAVLLDPSDYTQLAEGYNGMPRGIDESVAQRHERPTKYAFYEHAERNAIYNKARHFLKGSYAITTEAPSLSCTRALLSVGVKMVCAPKAATESPQWSLCDQLLQEAFVDILFHEGGRVLPSACTDADERLGRKLNNYLAFATQIKPVLSKDPYGGVTLMVSPGDFTLLTRGYSGQPRGSKDDEIARYAGELRAHWVESSVRNAIYNVVRPLLKGSVAVVTATTCVECARALASVGVKKVFYKEPGDEFKARWGASIDAALALLTSLGVEHESISD